MSETEVNDTQANSTMPDQPSAARLSQLLNTPSEGRPLKDVIEEVFGEEATNEILKIGRRKKKEG